MSLIKKIDVDAHFAERRRMRLAAIGFAKKPAAKINSAPSPTKVAEQDNTPGFRNN
jgi:hypothetical protein